jgi:ankyrin repeat protein
LNFDSEHLEYSISQGNLDAVTMILDNSRVLTTSVLRSALDSANQTGNDEITERIRDHLVRHSIAQDPISPDMTIQQQQTPEELLTEYIESGNQMMIDDLLEENPEFPVTGHHIYMAAVDGYVELVQKLLRLFGSFASRGNEDILLAIRDSTDADVLDLLRDSQLTPLERQARMDENRRRVRQQQQEQANAPQIQLTPEASRQLLMTAVRNQNRDAVIEHLTEENANYHDGTDSLLSAAMKTNNLILIAALLEKGARNTPNHNMINHNTLEFVNQHNDIMYGPVVQKAPVCCTDPGNRDCVMNCAKTCNNQDQNDGHGGEDLDGLDDQTKRRLVQFFIGNAQVGNCYNVSQLLAGIYNQGRTVVEWVRNPLSSSNIWETSDQGYGGIPTPDINRRHYVRVTADMRLYVDKQEIINALKQFKKIRLVRSQTQMRIGITDSDALGQSSTLHGQSPGEYIYTPEEYVFIPDEF